MKKVDAQDPAGPFVVEMTKQELFEAAMWWVGRVYPELAGIRRGCSLRIDNNTDGSIARITVHLGPRVAPQAAIAQPEEGATS